MNAEEMRKLADECDMELARLDLDENVPPWSMQRVALEMEARDYRARAAELDAQHKAA